MSWLASALVTATGLALGLSLEPAAPSSPTDDGRTEEVEACLRTCDAQDDETDRATCRLNCERAVQAKDEPNVIRWRRTEEIRGGFDGEPTQKRSTTTTTTTTPRGTPQTTTAKTEPTTSSTSPSDRSTGEPASTRPRSRYDALAGCQARCDSLTVDSPRATCKLQCLRDPWRDPLPSATTPTKTAPPATQAPRVTRPAEASKPAAASTEPRPTAPKTSAREAAACRRSCTQRAATCRSGCSGRGSDQSTCELQCDQVASRCAERCN